MSVAENLLSLMELRGISAYRLALISKVPHSTLSAVLTGKTASPSAKNLSKLAAALEVEVDLLLAPTLSEDVLEAIPPAVTDHRQFLDKLRDLLANEHPELAIKDLDELTVSVSDYVEYRLYSIKHNKKHNRE